MKFNIILTMGGGNFTYLCKDFTMEVGGVVNFELWILNWGYKKLWQTLKVCQRVYFEL